MKVYRDSGRLNSMADSPYQTRNFMFASKGVAARYVDDVLPDGTYLNMQALEEIEESGLASRLGTTLITKSGTTALPLAPGVGSTTGTPTSVAAQGPATPAWTNPANVITLGPNFATVTAGAGSTPSQQILASGVTPTIPPNATMIGFSVSFEGLTSAAFSTNNALSVALTLGGVQVGAAQTTPLDTLLRTYTLGSSSDLWGYGGWTAAQIIASLGILLQYSDGAGPTTAEINALTMTFYYSLSSVHSLQKLAGLNGSAWRYAAVGGSLYRRSGLTPGAYVRISSSLSGFPWTGATYGPSQTSYPYLYIADLAGMLKDNGFLSAPQQMGIFQPQYPVFAQAQSPDEIILDPFSAGSSLVSTTTAAAVTVTGIQTVPLASLDNIGIFQSIIIDTGGDTETVLVIGLTPNGIIANFTKTHLTGVGVVEMGTSTTVAASTTGTISGSLATSISTWPTTLSPSDYIGLWLYVGDPNAIESITLQFNTANGAYFYRTIGQGPLQATLNATTDSATAASDAILSETLGLYTAGAGGVTGLSTVPGWTPILLQLSDFSSAGGADFNDAVMNWQNVTTYTITIVTNAGLPGTSFPITVEAASLVLFGGAGPDSFAGVSYDYLFTYFNINDYTESNPSMVMTDVDPPFNTNRVLPRRQPVLLTMKNGTHDPQVTHLRIYRRGGTLADNYRRIDQVPLTAAFGATQTYTDIWSDADIQGADVVSFTNDVPVTSPLPVPMNNTLGTAIVVRNGVRTVALGTAYNPTEEFSNPLFVGQQVNIGDVAASNFETVIVLSITGTVYAVTGFTAFVQNTHAADEPLAATAKYGQPLDIMAIAFDQGWYGGDQANPSYLYWSAKGNVQAVSSAAYEPVSEPGDAITAIVGSHGNLFVSTLQRWWSVAPGSNTSASPTIYPTAVDHGCVGKNAWTLRDGTVFYLAQDGLRTFRGGGGEYISEVIEFVWQNTGTTPIPIADPTQFSTVCVSWWNRWVFFAYTALDGKRYRIVLDCESRRFRNDGIDAQSMFLEEDTSTLVWGDSQGLVHLDRQLTASDEVNVGGVLVQAPILIKLQTPYGDQGAPQTQKNYTEFTLDADTSGNPVTVELLFNDGEFTETIGTVTTSERQKVNLALNNGAGYQAYKVSMQLTGSGIERIFLYQAKIRHILLGETRTSFDSYDLRLGVDESKIMKQIYVETTATAPITCQVFYDGTLGYTFTIPEFGGVRNALRVRLPAVSFRIIRFIFTSPSDFILWDTSKYEWKSLCQGKGYSTALLMP